MVDGARGRAVELAAAAARILSALIRSLTRYRLSSDPDLLTSSSRMMFRRGLMVKAEEEKHRQDWMSTTPLGMA